MRISQLRDQLQAIEEIILEKELVNIVLNDLPKTWDAFSASMNTRSIPHLKNFGLVVHKMNQGLSQKRKSQKKYDDQVFTTKFKDFSNKNKFSSRKKPNQENDMKKIQCFNCRKYCHYKNHCPELKKRKETHEASVVEEREPSKKAKQDKTYFFF